MAEFGARRERRDERPWFVPLVRDWNVLTQYYEEDSNAGASEAVQVGEELIIACLRRPVARLQSESLCPEEHLATRSEIFHRLSRRLIPPKTRVAEAPPGKIEEVSSDGAEPRE
jgi:hypothetical protein